MGEQKSRNLQSEELLGFKSTTKETSDLNKNESVKLPEIIETNDEVFVLKCFLSNEKFKIYISNVLYELIKFYKPIVCNRHPEFHSTKNIDIRNFTPMYK